MRLVVNFHVRRMLVRCQTSLSSIGWSLRWHSLRKSIAVSCRGWGTMSNINPEERSRCLFENLNDAFFVFDPDGYRVLDANPTAERLTGLPCKQLVGMTLSELLLADEGHSLDALIQAYQSTGVFHSQEGYRLHSEKGDSSALNISVSRIHTSPKPLGLVVACDITKRKQALRTAKDELAYSSVPVRDGTGRVTGSLGILQDVTERKQSEVELRESEERLGLAMRGTSDGLWDSDLATGQEYWSPRFREMVEYDEDELEATYDSFLVHPEFAY